MINNLKLARPLAVIDLETTGVKPLVDRIVEISILKLFPDGQRDLRTKRLNPGIPIPPEATAVHGIRDVDVAGLLTFKDIAAGLNDHLFTCDLCGFNFKRFDLRLLQAEFQRADVTFSLEGRAILDAMEIYHAYERRDLTAAVRFYLDRDHTEAHSAEADVLATVQVMDAMLARYQDLPRSVIDLDQQFKNPAALDSDRFFHCVDGRITFARGKYRGLQLSAIALQEPGYLRWMLDHDFRDDTKAIVRKALQGAEELAPVV
jgi:DNA polymerase-3 subunit epsilon